MAFFEIVIALIVGVVVGSIALAAGYFGGQVGAAVCTTAAVAGVAWMAVHSQRADHDELNACGFGTMMAPMPIMIAWLGCFLGQ